MFAALLAVSTLALTNALQIVDMPTSEVDQKIVFEKLRSHHGRTYVEGTEEYEKRFSVYRTNIDRIKERTLNVFKLLYCFFRRPLAQNVVIRSRFFFKISDPISLSLTKRLIGRRNIL